MADQSQAADDVVKSKQAVAAAHAKLHGVELGPQTSNTKLVAQGNKMRGNKPQDVYMDDTVETSR